jgi:chromosome segregation ATPase
LIDTSKKTITELESELSKRFNQSMHTNKNEVELRYKIDELNAKILKYESAMRENKEEFYLINTENSNLKSDLKNLTNLERALRNEISNLVSQRQELEDALLRVKTKISKDALELRKYETENEALHRQVMSMENTITIATKEVEDLKNENDGLKD